VSNILSALVPFALLPVMTRYLVPVEYGRVAMFQVLVGGLGAVVGLNTAGAANRKFYDPGLEQAELAGFIGACMQVLVVTALLCLAVAWSWPGLAEWLGVEPSWLVIAVLVSAGGFATTLRLGQWQVRGDASRYGVLQVGLALLTMGLSLVFVVALGLGAGGRVWGQAAAALATGLVSVTLLRRDCLLHFSWRLDHWREALLFGVPLVPHIVGMFFLKSVDRAGVNDVIGLDAAGIYMVAAQVSLAMALVSDACNKAYVPGLYERLRRTDAAENRRIVKGTYLGFLVALLLALSMFGVGPWIVEHVAGRAYADAGRLVGYLALGQAFGGMYLLVTNYAFYSKRTGLLSLATITSGALNVVLLYLFVPRMGLQGAALAFVLAMASRFVLVWIVAQRRHPMPWALRS